jgi:hypothetical protein
MDLTKLSAMIRECIKKELEEESTSGAAGAYMTPNAFEKREKKDKNPFLPVPFGKGDHAKDPYTTDVRPKNAYNKHPKQPKNSYNNDRVSADDRDKNKNARTKNESAAQPITKIVKDRAENWDHELVTKKLDTDEAKKDHQTADQAHKKVPFGDGSPQKLPENVQIQSETISPTKQIGISVREIHNHIGKLKESLKLANTLKTENNLGGTNLWKRTTKQLTKTEAMCLEIARQIRELKA